ncbi:MAG TPA: hypothetical protein VEX62_05415 [Candidatus Limnocylindrales bacterium]|nr:hypothetical protein [Candidatus Limnocylindrales bacterium]
MTLARGLIVALLVLMVAVTPISAMFRPGYFEASLGYSLVNPSESWFGPARVALDDQTGLVLAFVALEKPPPTLPDDRLLVVNWLGGCSEQLVSLTFRTTDLGYSIEKREFSNRSCTFLIGLDRSVVLTLRAPVDARTVEFDAQEASVQ